MPNGTRILHAATQLADAGEAFALATVVWRQGPSSGKQGSRAIITADGELRGWIGGACAEPAVIREARAAIADGQPRLLLLGSADKFGDAVPDGMTVVPISCQSEGALEVYIEPVLPAPHLVVVGSSPMAATLGQLAETIGWSVDLLAGRQFTAMSVRPQSMVVIATQGHGDEDLVSTAVRARPAYLGLVGSRKRGAGLLGYLADRGLPKDQLDRVHVPAGLDLGHTGHEEMAVAILAELVQLRSAAGAPGPADCRAEETAPSASQRADTEGIDPVCGMTVPRDAQHWPLEHDGITDYFCCPGCRRAFEESLAKGVAR
jgi:xanthine dehydrogenase accessory factor